MENRADILTATDIRRDFVTQDGVLRVLKSLNLNVKRGEMVSVSGASGVGKSTLMHILGGLDQPTSGEVVVSGQSFGGMSHEALAHFRNKKVGFVFQFHYLLEDFRAELLLEQVGLKDRMNHLPTQLSGGEQQRVAVARALVNDPEIVLADEPSGNLDAATGFRLHELLFHLNAESAISFLIATHNQELAGNCHRQLEIVDGKIRQYVS
jgi:lipoprotein-releasing system ATP-binding protein